MSGYRPVDGIVVRVDALTKDPLGTVGRWGHDHEAGHAEEKDQVEQQGEVVDVAAEAVPLVPDQGHAQRVPEQVLEKVFLRY